MSVSLRKIVIAVVGALALSLGLASPAHAREQDGILDPPMEMAFYFNSYAYGYGSMSDFATNKPNLAGYRFLTRGNGRGQYVKNNAAAVANTRQRQSARVYFYSRYGGKSDLVGPGFIMDLVVTKNENASFKWL